MFGRTRQNANGGTLERRRSARWRLDKSVVWRVYRGRRIHTSRLVERSLEGLVLVTGAAQSIQPGKRLSFEGKKQRERLGCRLALVKGVRVREDGTHEMYLEIEA